MKKFFVVFALFCAMVLMISCGGGSKSVNHGDEPDTGETVTDGDTADSEPTDNDPSDSGHENPDTMPDNSDTAPDNGDSAPDGGDSAPDGGDTEPDNDYHQTPCDPNPCINDANSTGACTIKNDSYVCGCKSGYIFDGTLCIKSLPECSSTSETPCIDSATGLIWSAKSESKMPWNDAVEYCQNLTEGDFNDWRLPSIVVLKTLVQNCYSAKCTEDYTGKYSKFGDAVYLWSSSEGEDSTAQSIYFSDASTQPVSIDANVNVRCVRREVESRQSNCTGLIENSVWNTATQITQTWDWETATWTPSPQGSYNTIDSSSECRFKCDSNSFREDSRCLNPCKPNPCNSIGATGTCVGKSANEYTCECEENYFWDGSSKQCLNPCNPNPCTGIGETGICLSENANEYTCECENNYEWDSSSNKCMKNPCQNNPCNIPNSTGICNPISETEYTCECEENYFWDGSYQCLNPCDPNPCDEVANSTKVCTALAWNRYICGCVSGYYWWGIEKECKDEQPSYNIGNICTGQDKCYNASETMVCQAEGEDFFGQDAYYAAQGKCAPQSFTVQTISSQKVVLDNTGLMWQQTIPTSTYNWANAKTYCDDLIYAGYSDWRLPTPQELLTIVDNSKYNPAIDTTYFPDTPSSSFWSSSTGVGSTNFAWYVYFSYGGVNDYGKANSYNVRCVRGSTLASSLNSSSVNGDEIVTDTKTGLVWQKSYVNGKTWQQALSYCETLTYAGYSDWRLPDKNELASLVNYEKYDPASDFPDMSSNYFWSSSTNVGRTDSAWGVGFTYGRVFNGNKANGNHVRCVR